MAIDVLQNTTLDNPYQYLHYYAFFIARDFLKEEFMRTVRRAHESGTEAIFMSIANAWRIHIKTSGTESKPCDDRLSEAVP